MKSDVMNKMGAAVQQGFSFLEVLVAMLILGVAVMGFAGLQVRALQSTGVAHVRSQAMTLASEMTERIRANPSALATYTTAANWGVSTIPPGQPSDWASTCQAIAANVNNTPSNSGCTDAEMATFDTQEVQFQAQQMLPDGRVSVRNCNGALVTCVFVAWGGTDATDNAKCGSNGDPNCVSMQVVVQ